MMTRFYVHVYHSRAWWGNRLDIDWDSRRKNGTQMIDKNDRRDQRPSNICHTKIRIQLQNILRKWGQNINPYENGGQKDRVAVNKYG